MKLRHKLNNLFKRKSIPKSGEQTNTPVGGCFDNAVPSKDVVVVDCDTDSALKKIWKKIIS